MNPNTFENYQTENFFDEMFGNSNDSNKNLTKTFFILSNNITTQQIYNIKMEIKNIVTNKNNLQMPKSKSF